MTENLYQPPQSTESPEPRPEVPQNIAKKIKTAWVMGIVSGTVTLCISLSSMAFGKVMGMDGWSVIDAIIIFGLAYGIFKKSRICAASMVIYFIASKIYMILENKTATGVPLAIVCLYFYIQGVVGTFAYHKLGNDT